MTTDDPTRRPKRDRHVARSARILSTGLSATAILGITAAFGAADRAQSMSNDVAPAGDTGIASTPSALAPLGVTPSRASTPISEFPSPEGTITLPTGSPTPLRAASTADAAIPVVTVPAAAPVNVSPSVTEPALTTPNDTSAAVTTPAETTAAPAPTTPATVAPIAPAEPPVELTLPPAPSNGSSGGSR